MAERRMFAKSIIDSDAFLTMPSSTQLLYFHLCMRADDDGFVNSPRSIQRLVGASDDDFKILLSKRFLLPFDSGIIVIKHWRIHNYIQSDRYVETKYLEEKSKLGIKDNKAYTFLSENEDCAPLPIGKKKRQEIMCLQAENEEESKIIDDIDFLNKLHSEEKPSKAKVTDKKGLVEVLDNYKIEGDLREAFLEFIDMRSKKKRPLTQRALRGVLNKLKGFNVPYETQVKIVDQTLAHSWDTVYELKDDYGKVGTNGVRLSDKRDDTLDSIF